MGVMQRKTSFFEAILVLSSPCSSLTETEDLDVERDGVVCFEVLSNRLPILYIVRENNEKNSVALVRTRTIPTERPPPVGEVSANFYG